MKITVIMGTPRKKNGLSIIKLLETSINQYKKVDFEYIYLNEIDLKICCGCGVCKNDENLCPLKDDASYIKEKIFSSDGIVFYSPVYAYHETALIKNFFDRFHWLHYRPNLQGIISICIATAGLRGLSSTLNYLRLTCSGWGFINVADIGVYMSAYLNNKTYKEKIEKYIKKVALKTLKIESKIFYPMLNDLLIFKDNKKAVIFSKDKYNTAYKYWHDNKLLSKNYYYKSKIYAFRRVLSLFFKIKV